MLKDISGKIPAYTDILYDVLSFSGGMNSRSSEVFIARDSRFSMAKDQARLIVNLVRTQSGLLITRPGRVKLNASAVVPPAGDAVVRSIFELRPTNGNDSILINAGNTVYKYIAGVFTSQGTVATNDLRMLWCQFKDKAFGINGTDTMVSYDGTTLGTVAGAPTDGSAIASHRNRVWILRGRTLSYSALGDETDWTTPNNAGSVPVPTTKGKGGTALISLWDRLIVLTADQVFQLLGTSPDDFAMEPVNLQYGHTGSPTAVLAAGNDVYFCNKRGVHSLGVEFAQSNTGDVAYNYITGVIEPTWQALNSGNLTNVVAVHDSMHNLLIFLGNRTGTNNIEAFVADYYHLDARGNPTWSLYANMPFASAWEVTSLSSTPEVLFGGYDGFVYKQTDAETDDSQPINTQLIYITDLELPAFSKLWRHMLFFGGGEDTTLIGNITYDFGTTTIPFTANLAIAGGDLIGSTWVMGSSILGSASMKEIRISVPAHGRFATINMTTSSVHRVTIGGFIIYAGVRRLIHA
jgi:hypothetical protein